MRLKIVGKHADLSEPVKRYAREKVERLEKYFDRVTHAQIILSSGFVSAQAASSDPGERDRETGLADPPERAPGRAEKPDQATGHVACAELVFTVPREKAPLVATARGEGFHAAIDLAVDKMERQLTKRRERRRERRQPKNAEA